MKVFVTWLAIFMLVTLLLPFALGRNFGRIYNNDMTPESAGRIDVYFASDDKVRTLDFEEYILGVVMAEMPAEFESEALKAQAVAARTYTAEKLSAHENNTAHKGADICTDSTHCQAYVSKKEVKKKWGKNASKYFSKCKNAVSETKGIIAVYNEKPIKAVFHAFSSGATENAEEVWGSKVEYLKSVPSPGDVLAPKFSSQVKVDIDEFKYILTESNNIDFSSGFIGEVLRTGGGAVSQVRIGDKSVKGTQLRSLFNLRSACFDISYDENQVVFDVRGYGHGVGMSQYGANYYAKEGLLYDEILKKYYTGISLAMIE